MLGPNKLAPSVITKIVSVQKKLGPQKFGSKIFFCLKYWVHKRFGSRKILGPKIFWLNLSNLTNLNLAWPVITWFDLPQHDLIWHDPNWLNLSYKLILHQKKKVWVKTNFGPKQSWVQKISTWPVLTWLDLTQLDLTCPNLTSHVLTWPVLTWPVLTWPILTWTVKTWLVPT